MKKLIATAFAAAAFGLAWAKGTEQVSIVENEIATVSVPFGIKSYMPSNKDVVRIEELSSTSLRITALKRGRCDLEVHGDKDLVQKYEVLVLGDLAMTLETLTTELDQVQEVRARIVGDFIRIDGELSSIQKWEYLQKVLRNYGDVVHNFAVFNPGPDVMLRLKDTLQEAGFSVVFQSLGKDRKAWPVNTISLVLNKQTRIMAIQGRVYTPEQMASVTQCLSTERWLTLETKPVEDSASVDEFRIRGQFNVFVDKPQIRVSIAYMAIGDSDIKHFGNPNAYLGKGVLDVSGLASTLIGVVRDGGKVSGNNSSSASIGANINVVGRFLKQNGITRISDVGYTVMENWDKDGAKFKNGGTVYIPVSGLNSGELKEVEFGFNLTTKGGLTEEGDKVDATVDFSYSQPTDAKSVMSSSTRSNDEDTGSYDENSSIQAGIAKTETSSQQRLRLALGRTTFLGGVKLLDEDRLSPSGLPFLRNVPMLNWFVADSGNTVNDKRLVIMICPELVDNTKDGTLEAEKEINIPVTTEGAKTTEKREEEKLPHKGGYWNPLNWFQM